MMTVNEVSKLTGVSIRTLQYYDKIGLLKPTAYTESGYRQYDDTALEQLQQILLFRELEFSLEDIKKIMFSPNYDKDKALEQQIQLLMMKKEHIENLITLAREINMTGEKKMDFQAFDTSKMDAYAKQAKESWGNTKAYKEFEQKDKNRSVDDKKKMGKEIMDIIAQFGNLKEKTVTDSAVQEQVKKLQEFITENYYNCTNEILSQLGVMYADGGDFTTNINAAGGEGCAEFANEAIQAYCGK